MVMVTSVGEMDVERISEVIGRAWLCLCELERERERGSAADNTINHE